MKKVLLIIATIFCFYQNGIGQIPGGMPNINAFPQNVPSPTAASLGTYGQIPISFFNGLPNISIPLYDEDGVDISLSYHASGIRPDEHSGWVGLGWNLNSTGSITRIVNGGVDEIHVDNFSDPGVMSYYDDPSLLDRSNWDSSSNLGDYISSSDQIWGDGESIVPIPNPDEFIFNFKGYSGSFYYNHKGKWVVKTENHIKIKILESLNSFTLEEEVPIGSTGSIIEDRIIDRIFTGFVLTTPDGYEYTFGKTQNSVEFSLSDSQVLNFNGNYVATTWYLTKEKSPNNETVNYSYARDNRARFQQMVSTQLYSWEHDLQSSTAGSYRIVTCKKMFNCYLDKITTDLAEIKFNKLISNELKYDFTSSNNNGGLSEWANSGLYTHHFLNSAQNADQWYKLDDIVISDLHGNTIKNIKFNYLENSTSRLFLTSLEEYDKNYTNRKSYEFDYNNTDLPEYCSQELDHWGYYNGENYFDTNSPQEPRNGYDLYSRAQALSGDYYDSREPDDILMKAGSLEKITYPTGGYTKFYYEPHHYSKAVEKSLSGSFSVTSSSNKKAGGLRIQKIESYPESNSTNPLTKEYFYVNDYLNADMSSSGILSGTPTYVETGPTLDNTIDYWFWNGYSIEPLSRTNGNHVTYSKIVEKTSGIGFVEYTYSNHDTAIYADKKANNYAQYTDGQWKYLAFNGYSLERGKLLFEKYFNESNQKVKEVQFDYTNILDSDDNSIRGLFTSYRQFGQAIPSGPFTDLSGVAFGNAASVFEVPKYFKYLSSKTELNYENGVLKNSVVQNYLFNADRLLKESKLVSNAGEERITRIIYPDDIDTSTKLIDNSLITGGIIDSESFDAIERMQSNDLYQIATPVQKETYKKEGISETLLSIQRTNFKEHPGSKLLPKSIQTAKSSNGLTKNVIYHDYDSSGNLIDVSKEEGTHNVYVWGYEEQYPIAKIENAKQVNFTTDQNNKIATALTASDNDNDRRIDQKVGNSITYLGNEGTLREKLQDIRTSFPDSQVTTYTYDPLIGVTSITDPRGQTIYYDYDDFNRLMYVRDQDGKILSSNLYHYKN